MLLPTSKTNLFQFDPNVGCFLQSIFKKNEYLFLNIGNKFACCEFLDGNIVHDETFVLYPCFGFLALDLLFHENMHDSLFQLQDLAAAKSQLQYSLQLREEAVSASSAISSSSTDTDKEEGEAAKLLKESK